MIFIKKYNYQFITFTKLSEVSFKFTIKVMIIAKVNEFVKIGNAKYNVKHVIYRREFKK